MFLLYINDICNSSKIFSFLLYADDTTILHSAKDIDSLFKISNDNLPNVLKYFSANKLSVNLKKCNCIIFQNSHRPLDNYINQLKINNQVIPLVNETKFLGVFIDSRLSWKKHIAEIENKIAKSIGIIYRLSSFVPQNILRILYCSLILPYLNYCNLVWSNTYPSHLNKLLVLQKKAVRIISGAPPRTHTDPLFSSLGFLKIHDINHLQQCALIFSWVNFSLPPQFKTLLNFNFNYHNHFTRSSSHLHIPLHRTTSFQRNIQFTGPKLWNSLPHSILNSKSKKNFCVRVKKHLLTNYA